jgi:hypothetical protein
VAENNFGEQAMNWYKIIIAGTKQEYLQSLGISNEIISFILSQNEKISNILVNEIRKNPKLSIQQLQVFVNKLTYMPRNQNEEIINNLIQIESDRFLEPFRTWVIIQLRKMKKQKGLKDEDFIEFLKGLIHRLDFEGRKIAEISDWMDRNNINIASYSFEQAVVASDEWHKTIAGQGSGKQYEPTNRKLVVYGPKWKNKEWQGWTIQEIVSQNDLLTEGNMMNHCCANYYDEVKRGSTRFFSLRDPKNHPHVTMSTNSDGKDVKQIQGNSNQVPDNQYKTMIKEWVTSEKGPETYDEDSPSIDVQDINTRDLDDFIDNLSVGSQYGFKTNLHQLDLDKLYKNIMENMTHNYRYFDYNHRNIAHSFANLVIQAGEIATKEIEHIIMKKEEEFYTNFTPSDKVANLIPHKEDFDDTPEGKKQYDLAEEVYREKESEEMDYYFQHQLPYAFGNDILKYIYENSQNKQEIEQEPAMANNWYKLIKTAQQKKTIGQIAQEIRNKMVRCYDDECLQAVCLDVSRELTKELQKYGYKAQIVQGTFEIDDPNMENYDEWDEKDFNNEEDFNDVIYHPLHYWVEVNGMIIDITASQFNDEIEDEQMPDIVMGSYSEFPRYKVLRKGWK